MSLSIMASNAVIFIEKRLSFIKAWLKNGVEKNNSTHGKMPKYLKHSNIGYSDDQGGILLSDCIIFITWEQ